MRKALAIIAVMAAFAASAQTVTFVHSLKDVKPKTKECLIFEMDITMLKGTEVVDELGSKHIHLDWVPRHLVNVVYYEQSGRFWRSYEARLTSSKTIAGSATTHHAVMAMNTFEGGTDGYIAFSFTAGKPDASTPSVNCYLSGRTENRWDDELQRYVLVSGRGTIGGQSYPTSWSAWDDLKPCVPSSLSHVAPVWGTFTVRRAVLTDAEIIETLKQ